MLKRYYNSVVVYNFRCISDYMAIIHSILSPPMIFTNEVILYIISSACIGLKRTLVYMQMSLCIGKKDV